MSATVNLYLEDFVSNPLAVKQVVFKPTGSAVSVDGIYIITTDEISKYTNSSGLITLTNVTPGYYNVSVAGKRKTDFNILVPSGSLTYNAKDILANVTQSIYANNVFNITAASASYLSGSTAVVKAIRTGATSDPLIFGLRAGELATGSHAIYLGYLSGYNNQSNTRGVQIGYQAGFANVLSNQSVMIGIRAGYNAKICENATMIGGYAGNAAYSCSFCTFLGSSTNITNVYGLAVTKSIAIGYNALVSQSNQCVIGGKVGSGDEVNVGIGTDNPQYRLDVSGSMNGDSLTIGSTYNYLNDIPPIKIRSASLVPTVQPGSIEYNNNALWFSNLVVRRSVVQAINVITASVSASNSTSEFLLYTVPHGANYMKAGKMEEISLDGLYSSVLGAGNNALTLRVKWAGATVATFTTVEGAFSNVPADLHCTYTCRSIVNNTGSIMIHAGLDIDGVTNDADVTTSASFDSTQAADLTITGQWSDAVAGNSFVVHQGRALCIN